MAVGGGAALHAIIKPHQLLEAYNALARLIQLPPYSTVVLSDLISVLPQKLFDVAVRKF